MFNKNVIFADYTLLECFLHSWQFKIIYSHSFCRVTRSEFQGYSYRKANGGQSALSATDSGGGVSCQCTHPPLPQSSSFFSCCKKALSPIIHGGIVLAITGVWEAGPFFSGRWRRRTGVLA